MLTKWAHTHTVECTRSSQHAANNVESRFVKAYMKFQKPRNATMVFIEIIQKGSVDVYSSTGDLKERYVGARQGGRQLLHCPPPFHRVSFA